MALIQSDWKPLDHEVEMFEAMDSGFDRSVLVWHRGSGKDQTSWQHLIAKACTDPGTYHYVLPLLSQARRNIWEYVDPFTGKTFLDYIPKSAIANIRDTDLFIRLTNGSVIQPMGCDEPDRARGLRVKGVVFSEYASAENAAWHVYSPILAQSRGWAIFNSTPNGHNHFYDLVEMARQNPEEWFLSVKTVEDTRYHDGTPIISLDAIEKDRRSGIPEEFIQQEYYCSFESGAVGAYFANIVREMRANERIGSLPINPSLRVHTAWDIGSSKRNATAIWFFQISRNGEPLIVDYFEHHQEGLPYYANYVFEWARKNGAVLGNHYAPHDAETFSWAVGAKRDDVARELGIHFIPTPRASARDAIDAIYRVLPMCRFDNKRCAQGIDALLNYRQAKNEKSGAWSDGPIKDWTNHGVDAFRVIAYNIVSEEIEKQATQRDSFSARGPETRWSPYGQREPVGAGAGIIRMGR
jgi:hypothetical protein